MFCVTLLIPIDYFLRSIKRLQLKFYTSVINTTFYSYIKILWSIGRIMTKGQPKYSEKNLDQFHVVYHKSHTYWHGVTLIMGLTGSSGVDWILLAQDRDKWQALVNLIMILRGSLNMWNFFTTSGSIRCSKGTLVHRIDSLSFTIDYNCYVTHAIKVLPASH
jgi:hypothetical protein